MSRFFHLTTLAAALGLALSLGTLAGCNHSAPKEKAKTPSPSAQETSKATQPGAAAAEKTPAKTDEHAGHEHAKPEGHGHTPAAVRPAKKADPEGLKGLSPADRALAEKQAVCPVTDEPLGSMDTPVKVTVKGRTVFLCCAGCEEQIKKDPDKYLAKLDAAK